MKKLLSRILISATLLFTVGGAALAPAQSAFAADYAWSQSTCNPRVWWYGYPGAGSYYWTQDWGTHWLGDVWYQTYANNGYECGWMGAVTSDILEGQNDWYQRFEFGYIRQSKWTLQVYVYRY